MIFTDKFVYVHEPKTGGTFVTSVLHRIYQAKAERPALTRLINTFTGLRRPAYHRIYTKKYGAFLNLMSEKKHAPCLEIPLAHHEKTIHATIRNPYDLYVSEYEFGWWKRREFLEYYRQVPGFQQTYAHFPDLSFEEYLNLTGAAFGAKSSGSDGDRVGLQTEKFVKFYFKNPQQVLSQINNEYIAAQKYRADLHDLHFVRTDDLNRGLYDFLLKMGYPEQDVRFILDLGKILPQGKGRTKGQKWEKYYTPELRQRIRRSDRLIFMMFPEFDV